MLAGGTPLSLHNRHPSPQLAPVHAAETTMSQTVASESGTYHIYLPVVQKRRDVIPPFGIETSRAFTRLNLIEWSGELNVSWTRMNGRISWRDLQPEEGGEIRWEQLAGFERELLALRQARIVPVVIVDDYPLWATVAPTSCAAIRADKFAAFADFMQQLVQRYSNSTYNVYHWELGNEPDIDPRLVPRDNVFGCWGDIDDPYYGGEHYGEMLKVVSPVMRQTNARVRVWIGGLLLDRPLTTDPNKGRPELFLRGILESGAAPHFDVVGYHWYPSYWPSENKIDFDIAPFNPWFELGGGTLGKAAFLQQTMADYRVDKPLVLNEVSFSCPNDRYGSYEWCESPAPIFFELQADMLVRMMIRILSEERILGMSWYTLDGPGWRWGGLIRNGTSFSPAYQAYAHLAARLENTTYVGRANYAPGVEAYRFRRDDLDNPREVHVLWSQEDTIIPISVPQNKLLTALDRNGHLLMPESTVQANYTFHAGFEAIYIVRRP
jgi:hypothetical protein